MSEESLSVREMGEGSVGVGSCMVPALSMLGLSSKTCIQMRISHSPSISPVPSPPICERLCPEASIPFK